MSSLFYYYPTSECTKLRRKWNKHVTFYSSAVSKRENIDNKDETNKQTDRIFRDMYFHVQEVIGIVSG